MYAIRSYYDAFNLPERVGGGGLDNTTRALFERELGKTTHALHEFVGRPDVVGGVGVDRGCPVLGAERGQRCDGEGEEDEVV